MKQACLRVSSFANEKWYTSAWQKEWWRRMLDVNRACHFVPLSSHTERMFFTHYTELQVLDFFRPPPPAPPVTTWNSLSWDIDSRSTGLQVIKLYTNIRYITVFTTIRHWISLWTKWTQYTSSYIFVYIIHFSIILPHIHKSPKCSLLFSFPSNFVFNLKRQYTKTVTFQ